MTYYTSIVGNKIVVCDSWSVEGSKTKEEALSQFLITINKDKQKCEEDLKRLNLLEKMVYEKLITKNYEN